ncbi:MAG: hypothetical protein GC136_03665 [Alphaproteobacteria bacterium]|nr:hypothetical protein [Alphaproteobacteria bacterium]
MLPQQVRNEIIPDEEFHVYGPTPSPADIARLREQFAQGAETKIILPNPALKYNPAPYNNPDTVKKVNCLPFAIGADPSFGWKGAGELILDKPIQLIDESDGPLMMAWKKHAIQFERSYKTDQILRSQHLDEFVQIAPHSVDPRKQPVIAYISEIDHFMRYFPELGLFAGKPAQGPATIYDGAGNVITDPATAIWDSDLTGMSRVGPETQELPRMRTAKYGEVVYFTFPEQGLLVTPRTAPPPAEREVPFGYKM